MTDYVTIYLNSRPHMPITIPQTSNAVADELVRRASLGMDKVSEYFDGHLYLRDNIPIGRAATNLSKNPNSERLQDILRLRIAILCLEQVIGSHDAQARESAGTIIARLQDLVYELEHQS